MERRARLVERFAREFGAARGPLHVRAPGRVNLIGEHIDYCDLPVLPMALQREVRIVCAPRLDRLVRLANLDARYPARAFHASTAIPAEDPGDWTNYVRAALEALCQRLGPLRGMDAVVEGDIPPGSGLSSSSALLVASALACLATNEREMERLELAELCAVAEQYVGTRSGGMDQAIALFGRADHAVKIDFAPLTVEPIALPRDWRFVVADSRIVADKSGRAREAYNERRGACESALARLRGVAELAPFARSYKSLVAAFAVEELVERASRVLDANLLARFRHVVTENARVHSARAALVAGDAYAFGRAMNASHASLRDDVQVSVPELDQLVSLAREAGATGARLSGAGFGGAIVALVSEARAERLVEALERGFYSSRGLAGETAGHILVARASAGATLEA